MEVTSAVALAAVPMVLLGWWAGYLVMSRPARVRRNGSADDVGLGAGAAAVLGVLRSSAIVLDSADVVVQASPAAVALGLVRGEDLTHSELNTLARAVRRDRTIREVELDLPRGPMGPGVLAVFARIAPLGRSHVLLLVEDRTQNKRLEEVRRDFVANISHELKTPVGGIALLAEAVLDARDDPEAVSRFARRIGVESDRLSRLVGDIVDLSRLQASESLSDPVLLDAAAVVRETVDALAMQAAARAMSLIIGADQEAFIYGDAHLLATAVTNLVTNAINYSGEGTRVAVGVREVRNVVEITVSDQGEGIARSEQERIFERFYRVDAARSRATGGTGLGLAIVKHIATNHGGEVRVWSEVGQGATFTLRLPAAPAGSGTARTVEPGASVDRDAEEVSR
ncbi:MAG TPA: ATP-binding protein [Dermatophilaceae bacterium]|nr:ATP-binding protein [Dermatophilaceae bacterium]